MSAPLTRADVRAIVAEALRMLADEWARIGSADAGVAVRTAAALEAPEPHDTPAVQYTVEQSGSVRDTQPEAAGALPALEGPDLDVPEVYLLQVAAEWRAIARRLNAELQDLRQRVESACRP